MLVLRGVNGAESRERHDEPPRGNALCRLEQFERLRVAHVGPGVIRELVLRRAEVVVGDGKLMVALGILLGEFDHALGVGKGLFEPRGFIQAAELLVSLHPRILGEDLELLARCRGSRGTLRRGCFRQLRRLVC